MRHVFSAGLVFADGNPITVKDRLTPLQALEALTRLRATYPKSPPAVIVWMWDDPERGYFDADDLIEYHEEHCGLCGHKFENEADNCGGDCAACMSSIERDMMSPEEFAQQWPEYAARVEAEEAGPDMTPADMR